MTGTRKIKLIFVKYVLIASLIVLLISIYPLSRYASSIQIYSIVTGYLISFINALLGYFAVMWAFNKGTKSFMAIIFGGMLVRMVLVFLFLILLMTFGNFDTTSLIASVFFFYFLFVGLEIYYLAKNKPENKLDLKVHQS